MNFEYYMIPQLLFIIGVLLFFVRDIFVMRKERVSILDKNFLYFSSLIVFIGILFRILNPSYPEGVFVDGAMGAYDSWCLVNYGVDSNLASFPVYLKSWGTGQSALYAYLAAPFIKYLGLNIEAYRLPGALLGSLAIVVFYWMLRRSGLKPILIFCLTSFMAINPWHIIKCRFAVDCNIFPDIFLIAVCCLILTCYSSGAKKNIYFILGSIILGLSGYSYAVSWFMLPVFYILLMFYLLNKKIINVKLGIIGFCCVLLITTPLILFAFNLIQGGEEYRIASITITALDGSRHSGTTIFGMSDIPSILKQNLRLIFKMLVLGRDPDFPDTSIIYPYGLFYNIISLPFLLIGLFFIYKKREMWSIIIAIWLISCVFVILFVLPNVNRWNAVWFPLIIFTAYGIYNVVSKAPKRIGFAILSVYILSFILFTNHYISSYKPATFVNAGTECKEEIKFAQSKQFDRIHYADYMDYAYILFYSPIDPFVFDKTKIKGDNPHRFTMKSFSNVEMQLPHKIYPLTNVAYVIDNDSLAGMNLSPFKIKKGRHYSVIWAD